MMKLNALFWTAYLTLFMKGRVPLSLPASLSKRTPGTGSNRALGSLELNQLCSFFHSASTRYSPDNLAKLTKKMWSFFAPTPRPSWISIVIDRDTTSREARSFADGAYLETDNEATIVSVPGLQEITVHEGRLGEEWGWKV